MRRMPWRVAVYYWETGDERVLPLMQALSKFFCGEKEVHLFFGMRCFCHLMHQSGYFEQCCGHFSEECGFRSRDGLPCAAVRWGALIG